MTTTHTVRVSSINDIATCKWCDQPVLYVDDDLLWTHAAGPDADHFVEVTFEIGKANTVPLYSVGDHFVIESDEGSWLGEAYDTSSQGWTAFVEVT